LFFCTNKASFDTVSAWALTYAGSMKGKVNMKVTCNDEYLSGKVYSSYDMALIVGNEADDCEMIEAQTEYLEYYASSPMFFPIQEPGCGLLESVRKLNSKDDKELMKIVQKATESNRAK
jgi:hypothetical protein